MNSGVGVPDCINTSAFFRASHALTEIRKCKLYCTIFVLLLELALIILQNATVEGHLKLLPGAVGELVVRSMTK